MISANIPIRFNGESEEAKNGQIIPQKVIKKWKGGEKMKENGKYEVAFEVAGPLAMFTRPDTGGTPTSYQAPTWSASKGLFESIAFLSNGAAWICPTKVEVCRRVGESGGHVHLQRYTTNYGGPDRKKDLFNKGLASGGSSMQFFATVLSDACYRLYGVVVSSQWKKQNDPRHHLQDLFCRRLKKGQCFRTPCLGWSEFTCSYWGPFRDGITEVDTALKVEIPSMLLGVWDDPTNGRYDPLFSPQLTPDRPVNIKSGELKYNVPDDWFGKPDKEENVDAQ
jgi:CRISPR-associated protein Cas5d